MSTPPTHVDKTLQKAVAARARANVYGLLSLIFRGPLTGQVLEALHGPAIKDALCECGLKLPELQGQGDSILEALAVEYTRLFLGPGTHVSPHESVHSENCTNATLWGKATVTVKKTFDRCGLVIDDTFMPDHVSVELQFMQKLCEKEAESWQQGDEHLASECINEEQKFLAEHLYGWFSRFVEKVKAHNPLAFYANLIEASESFLELECNQGKKN